MTPVPVEETLEEALGGAGLTPSQEAALARLGCAMSGHLNHPEHGDATEEPLVVLLCGPPGVGKTTVLRRLATTLAPPLTAEVRTLSAWLDAAALPDIVLADDAHEADAATLAALLGRCRARPAGRRVVLAGEGRLLTLIGRNPRIERTVGLRAVLRPGTLAETRQLLSRIESGRPGLPLSAGALSAGALSAGSPDACDPVVRTIHEMTGGIAADVVRIAGLAAVLAAASPGRPLGPSDIELLHRRLTLAAA
jgi:hypothetical protein